MDSDAGLVVWWLERPWWLRWIITLLPLGFALCMLLFADRFFPWMWAVGGLLFLANLYMSWGEILDRIMPRR